MIELCSVSKWYGQVSALTDVSARIDGGVVGLVGRNGAGKSTLINLLVGLLRPSRGRVLIDGRSPTEPLTRRAIGFCADVDAFYEELSARAFVTWMLRLAGVGRREARRLAGESLERVRWYVRPSSEYESKAQR